MPSKLNKIVEQLNFNLTKNYLNQFKPDLIHQTYYSNKVFPKIGKICTVYDMINEKFSHSFINSSEISEIKKKTIDNSDHVICISENTKKDLIEIFNINEAKITVTLLASTIENKNLKIIPKKKYANHILFVGSRLGYKNFENFIKSFSCSKFLKNNFKIIVYGGENFSKIDADLLIKNKIDESRILFLNDDHIKLSELYCNVEALVYPSVYEGFGIPILEAMKMGCPVICSNGGSLQEVGGEGLHYFDPLSLDNIVEVLEKVLSSDQIKIDLIKYGFMRAEQFLVKMCKRNN